MAIKTFNWNPDTCNCDLAYTWDDSLPPEQVVISINIPNKSCSFHRNLLPNVPVTYSCILDENIKKSSTLNIALETFPNKLGDTFTNESGGTYVVLKNSITFTFRFEGTAPNRILYASFVGSNITQNEKNNIQQKLDQKFGNGVVVIE